MLVARHDATLRSSICNRMFGSGVFGCRVAWTFFCAPMLSSVVLYLIPGMELHGLMRACLNSVQPRETERTEAVHGRSVPEKKKCFGSIQNLGHRQPNQYER